jgi:deoxyribose-phosphate aldolase
MVINIGAMKSGDYALILHDIQSVIEAAAGRAHVKVILEMCFLDLREKIIGCLLCKEAGADFVKTSTGFGPSGATIEDVALMRRVVGAEMGVKAAGGIRTLQDALRMISAGANRLGASSGISILKEAEAV